MRKLRVIMAVLLEALQSSSVCVCFSQLFILFPVIYLLRKEMFYLMSHSTHSIYGYMASDI